MVLPSNQTYSSVWTPYSYYRGPSTPMLSQMQFSRYFNDNWVIESQISLGAGGEGQEKEAGRGGAGGDDIKICIDFAWSTWVWRGLGSMNKGPNATIRLVRRQNHGSGHKMRIASITTFF